MSETDKNHLLNNLKVFIDEQKTWLRNTLDFVGWNISDLESLAKTDEAQLFPCSINSEHRVPREKLLNHEIKCEKLNGDYPRITDVSDLEVIIDVKDAIHSKEDCKNELNDDVDPINQATKNKNERKGDSICLVELLAAERDAKRRRAAHRGKRVHSNKKSYVEVLREVVASQMETLNEGSSVETGPDAVEAESTQKAIIQPSIDLYLGVGDKYYNGNPFKRWMHVEEEEKELIERMQSGKNEKRTDNDRRHGSSSERHKQREKSGYDYDNVRGQYRKHRERSKGNDRYRDYKFNDDRNYYSKRRDEMSSSSHYDYEKDSKRKSHRDRLEEKPRDDNFSDSYESVDRWIKREKRSQERSLDSDVRDHYSKRRDEKSSSHYDYEKDSKRKSQKDRPEGKYRDGNFSDLYESDDRFEIKREKRSREPSQDSSKKHKKKHKKKSCEQSNDSTDGHKKKHKKRSRERSVHKKKHRKSKHHDSDTE